MERKAFEDSWRDAFQGKEKQPSRHVWDALAAHLANADAARNRKRLIFFQLLAAASVVFAMSIGFWSLRQPAMKEQVAIKGGAAQTPEISQAKDVMESAPTTAPKGQAAQPLRPDATNSRNTWPARTTRLPRTATQNQALPTRLKRTDFQQQALAFLEKGKDHQISLSLLAEDSGRETTVPSNPAATAFASGLPADSVPSNPVTTPAPQVVVAQVETETPEDQPSKNAKPIWTSVGFAGGGFTTSGSGGSGLLLSSPDILTSGLGTSAQPSSKQQQMGTAFSFGLSVGKSISNHWVFQTGLVYLQQSLGYTSNLVAKGQSNAAARVFLAESLTASQSGADLAITTPYELQANVNYLAIPVMAGYVVLDRAFSIQLNAGVATDILVQSTWQDKSGQFQDNRQSSDGIYRPINWAGLFNTEVGYRIGKHYRASLVPGVRYSLQPLYQPEVSSSLRPLIWDVGFRLKYQF